jgi:hypothetical protein
MRLKTRNTVKQNDKDGYKRIPGINTEKKNQINQFPKYLKNRKNT